MAKLKCLFIFLVYCITSVFLFDLGGFSKSIHIAPGLREIDGLTRKLTFEKDAHITEKNIPDFISRSLNDMKKSRLRRDAKSGLNTLAPQGTIFPFNDSHTQMVVHWAGKNSRAIIALTKGVELGHTGSAATSNVFVSHNYGKNFTNIKNKMRLMNNQTAVISQYVNSPIYNSHYIFTDVEHNYIFTTTDYGSTIVRVPLPFKPQVLNFNKRNFRMALSMDKSANNSAKTLYLTKDFGNTWRAIQFGVKAFFWEDSKYGHNSSCIYVLRTTFGDRADVIRSCDFFQRDQVVLLSSAHDFEIQGPYMFATRQRQLLGGTGIVHQIYVSHYRGEFFNAEFPHQLPHLDYYIADAYEGQIFMCVNHDSKTSHLYISNVNGTKFSTSLEDILYFNPNGSNGNTWLKYYMDESFADIHKVQGMRGVYIATQLINSTLANDHQRTLITFDKGGQWRHVVAPARDLKNKPTNCSMSKNCSLHLTQMYDRLYAGSRTSPILSRKSAPGLIIATGNTGSRIHVDDTVGVYISTDAGFTWHQVLQGIHHYAIADHGGVIVAVNGHEPTNEIVYSTDEGERWQKYNFSDTKIRVHGLLTEPGEKTTSVFLFGSNPDHHSWKVVSLNMSTIFRYRCTDNDYKMWSLPDSAAFTGCLLGRKVEFERRIPHTNCYNGRDYDRETVQRNCSCTRDDFECNFGFEPDHSFGRTVCRAVPDMVDDVHKMPRICPEGTFYPYTRGYVKIVGDTCQGGDEHQFSPLMYACQVSSLPEVLLYAKRTQIMRMVLDRSGNDENLISERTGMQEWNIKALDYEYAEKGCLYWADQNGHQIIRLCEDGKHTYQVLHNTSISSVESIAYDWKGNNIYWIDSGFKVIEVSKKNGKFRRQMIKGSPILEEPRSLALDPYHGYMYWSDWSVTNPRIMRAWMDGANSSIQTIIRGRNVRSPNGLTIDFLTERIYWTDGALHKIMSARTDGSDMRTILSRIQGPHSLALYKDRIYYADWATDTIKSCFKSDGSDTRYVRSDVVVMDMKVLDETSQKGGDTACDHDTSCSQLCLLKPPAVEVHGKNRTCRCADKALLSVYTLEGDEHCCPNGLIHNGSGVCTVTNQTCPHDKFTCSNGRCISNLWNCDRDDDCGDNSDEMDCAYATCHAGHFTCDNGRCIPSSWKCDFDNDCHDGSDELNCVYPNCSRDEFTCANGRCINRNWTCDFDMDCADGSDEKNCSSNSTLCEEYQIECPNGSPHCILATEVCDGTHDCFNGYDESNCTTNHTVCPSWKNICADQQQCVYRSWFCDGDPDCRDGSDEHNCNSTSVPTTPYKTTTSPSWCGPQMFRCGNGVCISMREHCDGLSDCSDHSDEQYCGTSRPPGNCSTFSFMCRNGRCIAPWKVCDGSNDCGDYSDERYGSCHVTTARPQCSPNQFLCYNSSGNQCIWMSDVCDRNYDCENQEDEMHCGGGTSCDTSKFYKCQHSEGCISRKDMCNDVWNCPDGSDEIGCANSSTGLIPTNHTCEHAHMFQCKYDKRCIPYMFTCDGKGDCPHSSDENLPQCFDVRPMDYSVFVKEQKSSNVTVYWTPYNPSNVTYIVSYGTYVHSSYSMQNITVNGTSCSLRNLHPAYIYHITVYVNMSGHILQHYKVITVTMLDGLPGQPLKITTKSSSQSRTIVVNWYSPSHYAGKIIKYRVYIKKMSPTAEVAHKDTKDGDVNELSLDEAAEAFKYKQKYSIWVTAFTSKGEGASSAKSNVTFGVDGIMSYVGDINAVTVGNHSLNITWTAPVTGADKIDNYIVEHYDLWGHKHRNKTTQTTFTIDGLCSGSSYSFSVAANNDKLGAGPELFYSAKTSGTKVKEPTNVTVELIDTTTVNVSWSLPKGADKSENFTVFYDFRSEDMFSFKIMTEAESQFADKNYAIIKNLRACEGYMFRVAVTGSGKCNLSPPANIQTSPDETASPKYIHVEQKDQTTANLTWQSACPYQVESPKPTGYVVTRTEQMTGKKIQTQPYLQTSKKTMYLVYRNLVPGANYTFTIQNTNPGAKKSESYSIVMDPYDAPEDLKIVPFNMNATAGKLTWLRVSSKKLPKEKFQGYEILVCSQKDGEGKCNEDSEYTHYASSQKEILNYTGLTPGMFYYFKVRLNKIDGYYGRLSMAVEIPVEALPSDTNNTFISLDKTNLIAIGASVAVVIVALATILACFIIRHRRLQRSFHAYASSHYDSSTGTTTFSAAEDLDEDEDSPMIRGFSDDEPLVIA